MKKIYYESMNKLKLCGVLTEASSDKIVIMCHGIRNNKDEGGNFVLLSEKLLEIGYSSFRFDFNGHGESEGMDLDVTISREINDLESTIKMLEQLGYKEFVLLGGSFGASIVSLFPFDRYNNVLAVVLWYGCLDYEYLRYGNLFSLDNMCVALKDGFYVSKVLDYNFDFKFGVDLFRETYKYKPYENLIKCYLPKLFIHGNCDSVVPFECSLKVSDECSNSICKIIDKGEHAFINSFEILNYVVDITVDFIRNLR